MARAKRALGNVGFATIVLRNTLRTGAHTANPMQYLSFLVAASILRVSFDSRRRNAVMAIESGGMKDRSGKRPDGDEHRR
jgi:hypothetical protein